MNSIDIKKNAEIITPLLQKLNQHTGDKLDENYVLDIWGKYKGDKGSSSFIKPNTLCWNLQLN
jgi:hypothetical protein